MADDASQGTFDHLGRWIIYAVLIGTVAGVGAIVFYWLLEQASELFLGHLAGYHLPAPAGEGNQSYLIIGQAWLLPLVVALGGLLSGLLARFAALEAAGGGGDAAIEAFHHSSRIRSRVPLIKMVATAVTIGSGGSGGREGPTAQISAGFGSLLGRMLHLGANERRILVAAGIGAGIGAIFRAPLGGALLAAEILYIHDLEVRAILPSLIASIIGYSIFGAWAGWEPIFGSRPELAFTRPFELVYYAALGILCGLIGILYARVFYGTTVVFRERVSLPTWFKPVVGGAAVGLMGMAIPGVLGTGYGWIQMGMSERILELPLLTLLLLPFAKILATSLSIGSGGSGGVFGPGMVIGGMVGAAFWRLGYPMLPGMPDSPAPFTIVAMMALFGSVAHAPLAVMLMVAEMTGNLSLLAPAMIAVGLATFITGQHTIYESQLPTRADSPAHRQRFSFPLLNSLVVDDAMTEQHLKLQPSIPVAEGEMHLTISGLTGAPVVDDHGQLLGVVTLSDIQQVTVKERQQVPVSTIMTTKAVTTVRQETLDQVFELLAGHHVSWMPVIERGSQKVVGVISASDIVRAYRTALKQTIRRLPGITGDTVMLEWEITAGTPLEGKLLRELRLPAGALVVSIQRDGATILPHGSTDLRAGDNVSILANYESELRVRTYLEAHARAESSPQPVR